MTTVFHKASISREKLSEIIKKNPASLMDGLFFIDEHMEAGEQGVIDYLGVDAAGRLVLVNLCTSSDEGMFIAALSQMYWLKKNNGLIKRLFFSENIDFSQQAQILLVASGFPNKLINAVKQVTSQNIKLVEFKYIIAQDSDAIMFEEIFTSKSSFVPMSSPAVQEKLVVPQESTVKRKMLEESSFPQQEQPVKTPRLILEDVSLSQEEIAEFMEFEKTLEEKKILS